MDAEVPVRARVAFSFRGGPRGHARPPGEYALVEERHPDEHRDGRHCFTIGYDRMERTYHFTSQDGEAWEMVGEGAAFDLGGWHTFYTRPASVLPLGVGYLFVYEGSDAKWYDPVYNIATGLAWTPDLAQFVDLTPDEALLVSTTPGDYLTWRYSDWMWVEGELFVYAEVARPNNTNEIRMWRLPARW